MRIAARRVLSVVFALVLVVCGGVLFAGGASAATSFGSQGEEAEQLDGPAVGLDSATGDVYVADQDNFRVDKFDGSGAFLFAWGWEVDADSPVEELQTCTVVTGCEKGISGQGAGEYVGEGPHGLAVDNNSSISDSSAGDVYVVDEGGFRVQKFDPEGKFLLMFGGEVNETKDSTLGATEAEKDVCVAGEKCKRGSQGTADGQFEWYYQPHGIVAVGPGGRVYVGDKARVQVFESSGAWRESISLAGLSSEGKVTALAVSAAGDVFVKDEGVHGVREFEPGGIEAPVRFDEEGSEAVEAITLDGSSDLFIADASGGVHILEYGSAGQELASFGSKTIGSQVSVSPGFGASGMAFSDALHELYVSSLVEGDVWALTPPPPGPLIEPGSESATPELHGTAKLQGTLNPEGNESTYHFEYVGEAQFRSSGWASATSTGLISVGSSFEDQAVSATLSNLAPGVYHYRLVATNSQGSATGPDQTLNTALVVGPSVRSVSDTSATFEASVNPLGTSTAYRLEYGTSTAYGYTISGDLGEGSTYIQVSTHQQGLEADSEYHFRLVISNEFGTFESADQSFTTQMLGAGLTLPDGRAWELVSPADKKGALIEPFEITIQAASDGSGIAYAAEGPHVGEGPHSKGFLSPVLSRRTANGWRTEDLSLPVSLGALPEKSPALLGGGGEEYKLFSPDLSSAAVEPLEQGTPSLSSEATERTPYIHNDLTGSFMPLVTPADVAPGTHFGGEEGVKGELMIRILAATPDMRHVVLASALALTPGAIAEPTNSVGHSWDLYEWNEGKELQLINILPNGEQALNQPGVQMYIGGGERIESSPIDGLPRAVSDNGRWVAWTWGSPYLALKEHNGGGYHGLYVRDTVNGKTYRVGGAHAFLQTMSADGSRIFYLENGSLYLFEPEKGTTLDLTSALGRGEHNAQVQELVMGASEDGSYVYFVATSVLASGGVSGEDNLYAAHDGTGGWSLTYIATLAHEDLSDWWALGSHQSINLLKVTSRVSPDGRYLTFMSERSLTGYDNVDAVSGQPDEEVYLYDAASAHLTCVSCNSTGARPVGVLDTFQFGPPGLPLVDRYGNSAWSGAYYGKNGESEHPHWLAGSLPPWYGDSGRGFHQPSFLSDSGRMFFNSPDALVPQDANGLEDVYEYEPAGLGDCTTASVTFSVRSGGCVNLISSGTSSQESDFFDASENGNDVFFITASKLVGADYDTNFDVYDAHVCSAAVPCVSEPVSPPPCTSGDSCKAAPSPQPEIFGPAPSATFSGTGNVVESKSTVRTRSLTKEQKLARALRACRNKRNRKRRTACERQVRRSYSAKRSSKATTMKGHR
jgi:hypothetical protein